MTASQAVDAAALSALPRLSAEQRSTGGTGSGRPPVRLVHLGLGAFHRSHQVWHTALADPEEEWGYASFTGRSADAAVMLSEQDGLYTVVERSSAGETATVVGHLVEAHDGSDSAALERLVSDPRVAVITLTITEAGYRLDRDRALDLSDEQTAADIRSLAARSTGEEQEAPVRTALGRLVMALAARRLSGAGAVTVLPCDNMPSNGEVVRGAVDALARAVSTELADWIVDTVAFASSVVDRITPATTQDDIRSHAAATGRRDDALVVTEPASEWVISGEFPAGRPRWERSGASIVESVEPFERRKLWMLNGAHTLMAIMARPLGHRTVAEAVSDERVQAWLSQWWDAAEAALDDPALDLGAYRSALIDRFENAAIEHHLSQIAVGTLTKMRFRFVPVILACRGDEVLLRGALQPVTAWIAATLDARAEDADPEVLAAADGGARGLLALLDERLALDDVVVSVVTADLLADGVDPSPSLISPEGTRS